MLLFHLIQPQLEFVGSDAQKLCRSRFAYSTLGQCPEAQSLETSRIFHFGIEARRLLEGWLAPSTLLEDVEQSRECWAIDDAQIFAAVSQCLYADPKSNFEIH